jgi:hypothetical protein
LGRLFFWSLKEVVAQKRCALTAPLIEGQERAVKSSHWERKRRCGTPARMIWEVDWCLDTSKAADRSVCRTLRAMDGRVSDTWSFFGGYAIGDFVVLSFGQDMARYQVAGLVVGTGGDDAVGFGVGHAGKRHQLVLGGGVQVERFVAAPAFTNSLGDRLGVAFHPRRGLRGFLSQFVGAFPLALNATRQYSRQEKGKNQPIVGNLHFSPTSFRLGWMRFRDATVGLQV